MKRLVKWIISERTVMVMIVLNSVALLGISFTDPSLTPELSPTGLMVHRLSIWIDYGCVMFFLVELVLKAQYDGWRPFWKNGWNRFDVIVVAASAPVLLSPWIDLGPLSAILILRLGRLFRLFRVLRFIPNREHLYLGMKRALRASVGVFLGLALINVVLSIGATQLFGKYAPEYFANPALASYSMFRVFTLEGWYEIPDAIARNAHPVVGVMARLYILMAVTVGGILGLSLANAVFVDEMTIDNNARLEEKVDELRAQIDEMHELLKSSSS